MRFPAQQKHFRFSPLSTTLRLYTGFGNGAERRNISCWATPFSPFLFVPPRRKTMLCLLYLLKSDSAFQRESFRCWNAGTASRKINSLSLYCTFSGNVDTCSVFLSPPFSFFLSDYLLRCRPLFPIDRRLSFMKQFDSLSTPPLLNAARDFHQGSFHFYRSSRQQAQQTENIL